MIAKETKSQWYVVRAQSNKERSVAEKLQKESEVGDLMGKLDQVIVPLESSFYLKNGKKVKKDKVKFPGYIFVQTQAIGELKYFLKGLNGASGFLTNRAGDILPLAQHEVDRMIGDHEKEKEVVEETALVYIPGQEVKILDGPFSTFTGKVESTTPTKVKVTVSIFGRLNVIELDLHQIDKL